MRPLFWVVVFGCASTGGDPVDGLRRPASLVGEATSSTGTDSPTSLWANCQVAHDNSLRAWCDVQADPPARVEVRFWPEDGLDAERVGVAEEGERTVGLYRMSAERTYLWEAWTPTRPDLRVSGRFTTGALPQGAVVDAMPTGLSSAETFLMASPCAGSGTAVVMTPEGEVVWYQPLIPEEVAVKALLGVSSTEDGTVLGLYPGGVVEVDWMGRERFAIVQGEDFDASVHHDVFKRDGHVYVLFQEYAEFFGQDFLMDGVYVFDASRNRVAEWHLQDVFVPTAPQNQPGAVDFSHANSVYVDEAGDLLVSMRHLSAVAKLNGDLAGGAFGEVLWRMSGASNGAFGSDFVFEDYTGKDEAFARQHNVHWRDDGRLAMFDNRANVNEDSRLLVLDVDEGGGTADIVETYALDLHCRFQGGAWHTEVGNPVATCAPMGRAFEFTAGETDTPVYEVQVLCGDGVDAYVPRLIPIRL